MDPVSTFDLPRAHLHGDGDHTVRWQGAFVSYGGHGADASTTIVFEIEPGCHLGWHTDQTEETQYIVSGTGELQRDDGVFPVGPIGFFSAAMFTQIFDNDMQPVNSRVLGTPNREG